MQITSEFKIVIFLMQKKIIKLSFDFGIQYEIINIIICKFKHLQRHFYNQKLCKIYRTSDTYLLRQTIHTQQCVTHNIDICF